LLQLSFSSFWHVKMVSKCVSFWRNGRRYMNSAKYLNIKLCSTHTGNSTAPPQKYVWGTTPPPLHPCCRGDVIILASGLSNAQDKLAFECIVRRPAKNFL